MQNTNGVKNNDNLMKGIFKEGCATGSDVNRRKS
jgi:hypothetical protein